MIPLSVKMMIKFLVCSDYILFQPLDIFTLRDIFFVIFAHYADFLIIIIGNILYIITMAFEIYRTGIK